MSTGTFLECLNIIGRLNVSHRVTSSQRLARIANKEVWTKVSKAVYVITDQDDFVAYVGKVDRKSEFGLAQRMLEHGMSRDKQRFVNVYVFPLEEHVTPIQVERMESAVALYLQPYHSQTHRRLS